MKKNIKKWEKPSIKSTLPLRFTKSNIKTGTSDGGTSTNGKNFS